MVQKENIASAIAFQVICRSIDILTKNEVGGIAAHCRQQGLENDAHGGVVVNQHDPAKQITPPP